MAAAQLRVLDRVVNDRLCGGPLLGQRIAVPRLCLFRDYRNEHNRLRRYASAYAYACAYSFAYGYAYANAYAMRFCAMPMPMRCDAVLCYAMLCYAMLCYAMVCYAMVCHAML